jgi:hypothetical protein
VGGGVCDMHDTRDRVVPTQTWNQSCGAVLGHYGPCRARAGSFNWALLAIYTL